MADGGPRLVAPYQNIPPNSLPHNHYLGHVPDNSYSRRKPPVSSLQLQDLSIHGTMASSSVAAASFVKNEFDVGGTLTGAGMPQVYGAPLPSSTLQAPLGAADLAPPMDLSILKNFSEKKVTRDGQPAKRRGPKPDSKPALTRRQELNRQAQRTHRERKEHYIKALEDEVNRLKEVYSVMQAEQERIKGENKILKTTMHQSGMPLPPGVTPLMPDSAMSAQPFLGDNASPSSASYALQSTTSQTTPFTPHSAALSANSAMPRGLSPAVMSPNGLSPQQMAGLHRPSPTMQVAPGHPQRNPSLDYDQTGINFVLALERPCMDHMPFLLERSAANGGKDPCGHALMATCPPEAPSAMSPTSNIPFGPLKDARRVNHLAQQGGQPQQQQGPDVSAMDLDPDDGAPQTWELSKTGLSTLLDLSKKLNLDGEITPVMAWGMVLAHPRLGELSERDFEVLSEELTGKVRCYGFGAVMEEFEVRDALAAMFSRKPERYARGQANRF